MSPHEIAMFNAILHCAYSARKCDTEMFTHVFAEQQAGADSGC